MSSNSPVRDVLLGLAAAGHRVPIGTHLVLHRHADPAGILLDGGRLGDVVIEAAGRFATPLALPLMDLTVEKEALLLALGVPAGEVAAHHLDAPPAADPAFAPSARMAATCGALRRVRERRPDLLVVGMTIGPFSLLTKLLADPITPVFLAGAGGDEADDPEVALLGRLIGLTTGWVLAYAAVQLEAGAQALLVCEPAANQVYFSPRQLGGPDDVFERFVIRPLRRLQQAVESGGAGLFLHDCGELDDGMLRRLAALGPALLSLGGSRRLWDDAAAVPPGTVLYGNLPTKRFITPELTVGMVREQARELAARMRATGHPFILGSECDVLAVPGSEAAITAKVDAFLTA